MLYSFFIKVVMLLTGTGLSRFPLVMKLYEFLHQSLLPRERVNLVPVQEHKMYVDIVDMGITPALVSSGIYHKQMTKLIKSTITKGMVCLDVGANIGYFTLILARLIGQEGKVFAFEPEPHNFDLLEKNIAINGYHNITPIQKAVSNKNGKAKLFLNRVSLAGHSLATPRKSERQFVRDTIEIEQQTLDTFFRDYDGKVDFVKIDVEGAELAVVEGMENIISKNKDLVIITEFFPDALRSFGSTPKEFLNTLLQYGFNLYDINDQKESVSLMDVTSILTEYSSGKATNLLAKRR